MLKVEALAKTYGQREVIRGLDLEIAAGQLWVLVGPNGAGKTTTLAMLTGQLVPDAGVVTIAGHDVYRQAVAARKQIGYVAQDLFLPPYLTLAEVIALVSSLRGATADPGEVTRLLSLLELEEHADRLIGELSHGMQRKAGWAAALCTQPGCLLIDEGLAGLDATSSAAIIREVDQLKQRGVAVLWIEHEIDRLLNLVDGVYALVDGQVGTRYSADQLRQLASEYQGGALMNRLMQGESSDE